jgi:mannose-6-phosphate isomerase
MPTSAELTSPILIQGHVQSYHWGKLGESSRLYPFSAVNPELYSKRRLAEYWLGIHPNAPHISARLNDGSECSLTELARLYPERIQLPFLLKVLSIDPQLGLSIQTHPDNESAKRLHSEDPKNYPDSSHKPEIGVALTQVTLLYDIKPLSALYRLFTSELPQLLELLNPRLKIDIRAAATLSDGSREGVALKRALFSEVLRADQAIVSKVVNRILDSEEVKNRLCESLGDPIRIMRRLVESYGDNDVGLLVMHLMHLVTLAPGEGMFIAANVPHAYLDGDLVECMACSDNVIRAGLTQKFRDLERLVELTSYADRGAPRPVAKLSTGNGYTLYSTPANEFKLGVVASNREGYTLNTQGRTTLGLCISDSPDGTVRVLCSSGETWCKLRDGDALLFPNGIGEFVVQASAAKFFLASND